MTPRSVWLLQILVVMQVWQVHKCLTPTVQVCRSKYCCKKSPLLLETLSDLLGAQSVEPSPCLSHCEDGANAQITVPGQRPLILNELNDVASVTAQLEMAHVPMDISKLLRAAATLLERVQTTTKAAATLPTDPIEQERLLNSVITKLSDDKEHCRSSALAHAYALRAGVRASQEKWDLSREDAKQVILCHDLKQAATDLSITLAYRTWADAEQQLESGKEQVLTVLQEWQEVQPSYRRKVQREMQDLLGK